MSPLSTRLHEVLTGVFRPQYASGVWAFPIPRGGAAAFEVRKTSWNEGGVQSLLNRLQTPVSPQYVVLFEGLMGGAPQGLSAQAMEAIDVEGARRLNLSPESFVPVFQGGETGLPAVGPWLSALQQLSPLTETPDTAPTVYATDFFYGDLTCRLVGLDFGATSRLENRVTVLLTDASLGLKSLREVAKRLRAAAFSPDLAAGAARPGDTFLVLALGTEAPSTQSPDDYALRNALEMGWSRVLSHLSETAAKTDGRTHRLSVRHADNGADWERAVFAVTKLLERVKRGDVEEKTAFWSELRLTLAGSSLLMADVERFQVFFNDDVLRADDEDDVFAMQIARWRAGGVKLTLDLLRGHYSGDAYL